MTTRTFEIRTEPHQAHIGEDTLLFEPEVIGSEFAQAYDALRVVQAKVNNAQGSKANSSKPAKASTVDATVLSELSEAMRSFVARFLLEESRPVFDRLRLPDRVLVELMQFVAELYGGGSGNVAGGPSSA